MNNTPVEVILVGLDAKQEAFIVQALESQLRVVASEYDPEHALAKVSAHSDALVLVLFDKEPPRMLHLIEAITSKFQSQVIVLSATRNPRHIVEVMKAGAKDFATIQDGDVTDIQRALQEMMTLREQVLKDKHGKVISIFGAKGGSGATTVAANLAHVLQQKHLDKGAEPRKVVILDFDMDMGDLSVFLDVRISYNYQAILENMYRLDGELLYSSLTRHNSGLFVVSHSGGVDDVESVTPAELTKIVEFFRQHFDFVIIDGLRGFSERCLSALDNSDHIVITITPDIPSLRNVHRSLQIFERLQYAEEHVHVVMNRSTKKANISVDEMADALGRPISCTIANDFPLVNKSVHLGSTVVELSPRSKVTGDYQKFGELFVDAPRVQRRSFLPFRRN